MTNLNIVAKAGNTSTNVVCDQDDIGEVLSEMIADAREMHNPKIQIAIWVNETTNPVQHSYGLHKGYPMTRINLVPPAIIHTKQLVAEYYELPEIFMLADKAHDRLRSKFIPVSRTEVGLSAVAKEHLQIPPEYVRGPGHKRFFYDKLWFLYRRHEMVRAELLRRGVAATGIPSMKDKYWLLIPYCFWGTWEPNAEAISINIEMLVDGHAKAKERGSEWAQGEAFIGPIHAVS